jgi:PKD repeat protein
MNMILKWYFVLWLALLSVAWANDMVTEPIHTFKGHTSGICMDDCVAFSSDGQLILSSSYDQAITLWKVSTGEKIRTFYRHTSSVHSMALSHDDRYVLSGSNDYTIRLWEVSSGAEIRIFQGHTDTVMSVALSPDGRYALSGSKDDTIKLWEVSSGAEIRTIQGNTGSVWSVAFSPDGDYALSGSEDIKLWDVSSGAEIRTFQGHTDYVYSVAFSPDGQYALSGSLDNTIKLWEVSSGAEIRTFQGHSSGVVSVAFSPGGRYAISGSWDRTSKLWEVSSGALISTFQGHTDSVMSVAFSPDSHYVLSGSNDKTLKLWRYEIQDNQSPLAAFTVSPTQGEAPLTVQLDASTSSDPDGSIVQYEWTLDGESIASGNPSSYTFNTPGEYVIRLTVTDDQGLTASTQKTVKVLTTLNVTKSGTGSGTVTSSPSGISCGSDCSQSYDYGSSVTLTANPASDSTFAGWSDACSGTASSCQLEMNANKNVTATFEKQSGSQPPIAQFTVSPTQGQAPLTVTLDASASSSPDGEIVNYEWAVEDQTFATGEKFSYTFTTPFEYQAQITLTVTDNQGLTASTQQNVSLTVTPQQTDSVGQAIIIAGPLINDNLFPYSNEFSQRLYRLLKKRQFGDDDIHYMNLRAPDIELDGLPETDRQDYNLFEPKEQLEQAFAQAAARLSADQQFIFYLHGHARQDRASLGNHELSASKLRDLLATLPADTQQIIIIDTCYSGSFFDELAGVENRVLISSADDRHLAWQTTYGSFADKFIRLLEHGSNVLEAFQMAEDMMLEEPDLFFGQSPWLDDNGDGQYLNNDGTLAANIFLGRTGISQAPPPKITQVHPRSTLHENVSTATLWVKTSPSGSSGNIYKVQAVLVNPNFVLSDYQGEDTDFSRLEIDLIYNAAQDRYEVVYDGFCMAAGLWKIRYQAQDTDGIWSEIATGEVQVEGCSLPATVSMLLNQNRYTTGEQLRLDMFVNGQAEVDLYVAIMFPAGYFQTITYPLGFSMVGAAQAYQSNVEIAGQKTYPIMNFQMPNSIPLGQYQACGVLVDAGTAPLEQGNWIHIDCAEFEVY